MNQEQGSQSDNSEILQFQDIHEIEQQQLNEFIENEKPKLKQLSQQYQNLIQQYFNELNKDESKNNIKKFVDDQLKTYSKDVEKIIKKQYDRFKSEKESHIKQIKQLIQKHQQQNYQKNQEIDELTQKLNEANNLLNISTFKDDNVYSKLTQISTTLEKTCETTIQASQQLGIQNLDQIQQQIQMIKQNITGDTEIQLNSYQTQLNQKEQLIAQLQKEILDYKNQERNNNSSAILTKKMEEFLQKYQNQFNQADQINQKTNQIVEINKELNKLNTLLNNENEKLKNQYEEEKNKAIHKQLEGCFKLQDRSLLYIQLGLKIFQQYYYSHIDNNKKIQSQIDRLNKFHQNYQKKENFKLKDLEQIEQFYIKQEQELKNLFDDSLNEYKNLLNEITQRRKQMIFQQNV
ncbi:unnamed protein product [Paramecium pentaurelia]|uniref:Uncharacterized protein n=1 Tax=Paramecium pentaurelia TaxID=43138 RepID=A0A8S1TJF3_9CILI|nr:unnamed protein product [Paramecium pentaurelia]